MKSAPGKNFLFVTGILYIVFGGMGIITSAVGLATANYWDRTLPIANDMSWSVHYTIALISSLFYIFVGIMGVINCARLEKASILRVLGCIDIGHVILSAILVAVVFSGALGGFTVVCTLVLGFVLPILFIIGAQKNHSQFMGQ